MYGRPFYDAVSDALTSFLPPSLRDFEWYRTSHNLKLWYSRDGREHYEVQVLKHQKKILLEIGFHAEHTDKERNDEVIARLVSVKKAWGPKLGKEVEVGPFIGHQSGSWRRISELWDDAGDPDAAVEAAERLALYIRTLEPLRSRSR